jgi:hypothetical protein
MIRGWQRVLLLLIALGVLISLVSPYIPDPLSIPGKNVVIFAIFMMAMFFPHALLARGRTFLQTADSLERFTSDRLALICKRVC